MQPLDAATERGRAVTDIRVMAEDAELPLGYEVLTATMFGADARLNRGVWAIAEARTYLCVSRDAPGPPITGASQRARVSARADERRALRADARPTQRPCRVFHQFTVKYYCMDSPSFGLVMALSRLVDPHLACCFQM